MKIVTYNIQFGLGKDGRFDLDRIASEVEGADIITLQEVERYWRRSGNVDQPAQLAQILDRYYWAYGPSFDVDASTVDLNGRISNVRRQFGNMILSKTPILSSRLFPLPKTALTERHNMVVGLFEGVIDLPDKRALRIYNAHLSARSRQDRIDQIQCIRETIKQAPAQGGTWTGETVDSLWAEDATPPPMPNAFVLLGDFNLAATDPEYDCLVDPANEQGFVDTWVLAGHDKTEGVTFCDLSDSDQKSPQRVDFAFIDKAMEKQIVGAKIDDAAQGSDHQPYWIDLADNI